MVRPSTSMDRRVNGAQFLEIDRDAYICESIRAITTENGLNNFEYIFKDDCFSWSKKTHGCPFTILFGN